MDLEVIRQRLVMERGLVGLASTAAMVPGPIGHIGVAMAGLGLSMGALLAITAILAGAALLFKKLGDAAQLAADNVVAAGDRMRKNLASFVGAHETGAEGTFGLALLRRRLEDARDRLTIMQAPGDKLTEALTTGPIDRSTEAMAAQENVVRGLQQAINDLEKAIHDMRVKELRQWAEDMKPILANLERIGGLVGSQARILATGPGGLRGMNPRGLRPVDAGEGVNNLRLEMQGAFDKDREKYARLGESVGRTIMTGLIEGMQSMQEILKSIFLQILQFGLGEFLGAIFHPSSLGLGDLAKASPAKVMGPASMSMNMNMSGVQPLTAFAIARDPGFQQAIRETLIVAVAQGFKGGR